MTMTPEITLQWIRQTYTDAAHWKPTGGLSVAMAQSQAEGMLEIHALEVTHKLLDEIDRLQNEVRRFREVKCPNGDCAEYTALRAERLEIIRDREQLRGDIFRIESENEHFQEVIKANNKSLQIWADENASLTERLKSWGGK